jgi:AcrR family transcriptional regulator
LDEEQLTTDRQRQRRERILDAAVDSASAGGYDRVHISERASVAIATLYHHFPSKVHLLTNALGRELIRFDDRLNRDLPGRTDPLMRLRLCDLRVCPVAAADLCTRCGPLGCAGGEVLLRGRGVVRLAIERYDEI